MKNRKLPALSVLVLSSAAGLGVIAQTDLPLLLKEVALLLPLQIAALSYVVWYWRDRQTTPNLDRR